MTFRLHVLVKQICLSDVKWPPLAKVFAFASIYIGLFMAVCAISYLRLPMGSSIAAALLAVLALASPLSGLLLILTSVNFEYLFSFEPVALYHINGALCTAYILRSLPITVREIGRASPLWVVLAVFIGLVVLHLSPQVDPAKSAQAIGFCLLTAVIFLHARSLAGTADASAAVVTVCISEIVACILSFVYLYLPAPELLLSHSPLYDLRLNDLRLSGAQDDPNAIAKLLLPAVIALMLLALTLRNSIILWIALLVACGIILAASGAKSIILPLALLGCILSHSCGEVSIVTCLVYNSGERGNCDRCLFSRCSSDYEAI